NRSTWQIRRTTRSRMQTETSTAEASWKLWPLEYRPRRPRRANLPCGSQTELVIAIGLMSGTSADGVSAAMIRATFETPEAITRMCTLGDRRHGTAFCGEPLAGLLPFLRLWPCYRKARRLFRFRFR